MRETERLSGVKKAGEKRLYLYFASRQMHPDRGGGETGMTERFVQRWAPVRILSPEKMNSLVIVLGVMETRDNSSWSLDIVCFLYVTLAIYMDEPVNVFVFVWHFGVQE